MIGSRMEGCAPVLLSAGVAVAVVPAPPVLRFHSIVECVTGQLLEKAPIFMAQQRPEEIQLALLFFFVKNFSLYSRLNFPSYI